jgi:hypothetical protein
MRTTLTLDRDVAGRLKEYNRRTGTSFKQAVNDLLRLGLEMIGRKRPADPFRVRAKTLKLKAGYDLDNIGDLLDRLDTPGRSS